MSIKAKLSFSISVIVAVILALSIIIYYFSAKSEIQHSLEEDVQNIAMQIGRTLEISEEANKMMENTIGEKLRIASISIKSQLGPDIANIQNEQLVELSSRLNVDHITLWQKEGDDVIARRSSDPNEINFSSKSWGYWHTAFLQLFEKQEVTIEEGQKLEHYWSGPFNFAATDPMKIRKWGYYYDGETNYMINPYVNAQILNDFSPTAGTDALISKMVSDQRNLLEITGFDPQFFGKSPIIEIKMGIPVYNLDVRDIPFGTYTYKDEKNDSYYIQQAISSSSPISFKSNISGKLLHKTFIPIHTDKAYVIGVTFDNTAVIEQLNRQFLLQSLISLGLILITMLVSYFVADYMLLGLKQIIHKVNAIAEGNFGEVITIRSNDELGLLAERVDTMGANLFSYTTRLQDAADELRHTKQYLESLVDHTSDAIHVTDLTGRVTQVNKAFETMYGWSEPEVVGSPLHNVPAEYVSSFREITATVLNGGSVTGFETVRYTKSGELIDLSITVSPIRDEDDNIIAIATISRNITSRKQTEEMIRRSEKLSVVGQIAAGVAHEVRNPLTTLRGFVQLAKQKGSLSPDHLNIMLSELDQINMIVSEFLVFARPQASRVTPVNIIGLVNDIVLLLDSEAKLNNVQIILHAEPGLPELMGEPSQLKQVFVNIMKNGIEAMEIGGELTIELASVNSSAVLLRFIDQGNGINEEDLQRLGEPFFTRKEKGNGLGLMVSQQIIAGHKGTIVFHSTPGSGTCVEISLPIDR